MPRGELSDDCKYCEVRVRGQIATLDTGAEPAGLWCDDFLPNAVVRLWRRGGPTRGLARDLLRALRTGHGLTWAELEMVDYEGTVGERVATRFYGTVATCLARMPLLHELKVRYDGWNGEALKLSQMLRGLHQVRDLTWDVVVGSHVEDDSFDALRSVFADKHSIEALELRSDLDGHDLSNQDIKRLRNCFILFAQLPSLRRLKLDGCLHDRNTRWVPPLLQLPSLEELEIHDSYYLNHTGATTVCRAVGASGVRRLTVDGGDSFAADEHAATRGMPILLALQAPRLRAFHLSPLVLPSQESVRTFLQTLKPDRLDEIGLSWASWPDVSSREIATTLCHPNLKCLKISFDRDGATDGHHFLTELGRCLPRSLALNSLTVSLSQLIHGDQVEAFLRVCARRPELTELRLPALRSWTAQLDKLIAICVSALPRLTVLGVSLDRRRSEIPKYSMTAPALLEVCWVHPALETVELTDDESWCRRFRKELKKALATSKEVRMYQERFASLLSDAWTPAIAAPALLQVQSKPRLLYLGVHSFKLHLL